MNKTVKIILIVALVIAVIVGLYFAVKASQPQPLPAPAPGPGAGIPPQGNQLANIAAILGGLFKNLFGGGSSGGNMANPACQQANPGFDNNGYYTTACGGVPGGGGANCDPNNPGKDMNGFLSSQCGG